MAHPIFEITETIQAAGEPIVHLLKGRWVNLTTPRVHAVLWPVWQARIRGELTKDTEQWLSVWRADGGAAFIEGMEWFGAIPGDAMRSVFLLLFEDESLLEFSCVDSCTETELEVRVWSDGTAAGAVEDVRGGMTELSA